MPSIISHAIGAFFVNKAIFSGENTLKISILVMVSAMIPDIDFIGYRLGILYQSTFGHRGFTHSIFFAVIWSLAIYFFFFYAHQRGKLKPILIWTIFFLATLSHPLLDACTSGGEGVALFSPFSNERFFFPFRPIRVSPLGVKSFFSNRGIIVILSEIKYIWIPTIGLFIFSKYLRWIKGN